MKVLFTLILTVFCQFAFAQKKSEIRYPPPVLGMNDPEFMSACDLPAHKGELVYTRFTYSGVEEYWGLRPEEKCDNINAYLDIPNDFDIKPEDRKQLKYVHKYYMKSYLIMDVIGTLDDAKKSGYGHLGSNNSSFKVKYIINIQTINKTASSK